MAASNVLRVKLISIRACAALACSLVALAGCGSKRKDGGDTTLRASAITAITPGSDTPLTDLAAAVSDANGKVANLVNSFGGEGTLDGPDDDAALAAAQLANAAERMMEQIDERELEQGAVKKMEAAVAAVHAEAAALADAAANAMDPDDGVNRVVTLGAVATGAHAAAAGVADAAAALAAQGAVCGTPSGLQDLFLKAAAGVDAAKQVSDAVANIANNFGTEEGELANDLFGMFTAGNDASASASTLSASLNAGAAALTGDPTADQAIVADVGSKVIDHKGKTRALGDATSKTAIVGAPDGNAEANANAGKAGAGDADPVCASVARDAMKKLTSAVAAANTAKAAMAASGKKKLQKSGAIESKKKLGTVAEEGLKAASHLANAAAKAEEAADELGDDVPAKKKIIKAAAAGHLLAVALAHEAAKLMDETAPEDGVGEITEQGATLGAMRVASDSLADASGEVADGAGTAADVGQTLTMTAAVVNAGNTAAEQMAIISDMIANSTEDQGVANAVKGLRDAANDKIEAKDLARKTGKGAVKHAVKGEDPTGAAVDIKTAAGIDRGKSKATADAATGAAGSVNPGGNPESISKMASAHASDAPDNCVGIRKSGLKKIASSMTTAKITNVALAAAIKKKNRTQTDDSKKKVIELSAEVNKAAAHLGNAAAKTTEGARELDADTGKAESMEKTAAGGHTLSAAMAEVASKTMDADAPDDGTGNIAELSAVLASVRAASNTLEGTIADQIANDVASIDDGLLMQVSGAGAAAANTLADQIADIADAVGSGTEDANLASAMADIKSKAQDSGSRLDMTKKHADATQKLSDQTKDPTGAGADLKQASIADRGKAKATADSATGAAGAVAPGGNAESITKIASAGASDADSTCSIASQEALKKLASSMAAAHAAAASLASAEKKAQKEKSAEAHGKLGAAKAEAHKASSHLANTADKAMEGVSEIGLDVTTKEQIESMIAAAHTAAAGLADAAGQTTTDDSAVCNDVPVSDLGAMLSGVRVSSNALAQSTAQAATGGGASVGLGIVLQMTAVTQAVSNTVSDNVGDTADAISKQTQDTGKKAALDGLNQAAKDKGTSLAATKKTAEAAQKHSDKTKDPTGAAPDMKTAAITDKGKAKATADASDANAQKIAPGGAGESLSKNASAGADSVASVCGGMSKEALKKLSSSTAAAHTVSVNLMAAERKHLKTKTAESNAKLAAAKGEMHKASSKLGNEAGKAVSGVSETGPTAITKKGKIEIAGSSGHNSAAGMSEGAGKIRTDDGGTCAEEPIAEMGALVGSMRAGSNNMALATSEALSDNVASSGAGVVAQLGTVVVVSANRAAAELKTMLDEAEKQEPDSGKRAAIETMKQAADDKATSEALGKKHAETAQKFSSATKGTTGASGDLKTAAQADRGKAKGTADAAANTAIAIKPGSSAEAIAKNASAGASDAPVACGPVTQEIVKKLASAMAAAHTAGANLAAVQKKAADVRHAEAQSKLAAARDEALKAAAVLANVADKVMEEVAALNLPPAVESQLETTATAAHVAAAALAHAASKTKIDDSVACNDTDASKDLGAMLSAHRVAANNLALSAAQALTGATPAVDSGLTAQMTAVSQIGANTTADRVSELADKEATKSVDVTRKNAIQSMKSAIDDKSQAINAAKKTAEGAQKLSDQTKDASTAATDMKSAALADRGKAKATADASAATNVVIAPTQNGESLSKAASAGATDGPASCGGASSNALKKLASALAAVETTGAALVAVHKRSVMSKGAESVAKLNAALGEANKAAARAANIAAKTMESTGALGLQPAVAGQLESTLAAAHTVTTALANAVAVLHSENDAACADPAIADIGALLAAVRMVANSLAQTIAQTTAGAQASAAGGHLMMMGTVSSAAANTSADEVSNLTDVLSAQTTDTGKLAGLAGLKGAAKNNASAWNLTKKQSDAALAHAGAGGSPSSASSDVGTAATADKGKAKTLADAAITNAKAHAAGGKGEAISKLSKASSFDLQEGAINALQDLMKRLASSEAAAQTVQATLMKMTHKVAVSKTAESTTKKEEIVKEAIKAAAQLANIASKTLDIANGLGLTAARLAKVESAVAAAHTMATSLAHLAAKVATDDPSICAESSSAPEMTTVSASGRTASNAMNESISDVVGGGAAAQVSGHLLTMGAAGSISADIGANKAGDAATAVANTMTDSSSITSLQNFNLSAKDQSAAQAMENRQAEAAESFANADGDTVGAASAMKTAVLTDKAKSKGVADAATGIASVMAAASNTLALSKLAAAAVTADATTGPLPTAAEAALKRVASAVAAAHTAAAALATAAAKADQLRTAASIAKLHALVNEAIAAATQAANIAAKVMDVAGTLGLSSAAVAQLETTVTAMHTAAAALSHASAQHTTDDKVACASVQAKLSELGAMLGGARAASTGLSMSLSQVMTPTSTQSASRMAQFSGAGVAAANTTAEKMGTAASFQSAATTDTGLKTVLNTLVTAVNDKTTAWNLANKIADASQIFASGVGSKTTAASDVQTAAVNDKIKSKGTADAATGVATKQAPGSNAESLGKMSSAAVTGDPTAGGSATALEALLKRLAASMAAAHTAASHLATAVAGAAKNTTAESVAKAAAAVKAASTAAVQLGNTAGAVGNAAGNLGLPAGLLAQLRSTVAASQAAATNLANAAAQATLALSGATCSTGSALAGLEGAVSAAASSASSLATLISQAINGLGASGHRSRIAQLLGAALASASTSTKGLGDAALSLQDVTSDPNKVALLVALQSTTANNGTELVLVSKAAVLGQTIASGGSSAAALSDLNSAISGVGSFLAGLGSAAGAAAATTPTARIEQLSEPSLWTATNGTLSKSPISVNGFDSLSVASGGYTPVVSAPMSSSDIRATAGPDLTKISYALYIPTDLPNPFWVGATQMFITAPSANVFNAYLGEVELTGLALQTFLRPTFTVPAAVLPVLTGNRSDVTITVVINVNAGTQGWLLNDLRFGQ